MDFRSDEDVRECDDIREELQPYVLSQYSASPTITQILKDFRDNIDPQADINLFMEKMMDIETAAGFGLDVWGNILNIGRTVTVNGTARTLTDAQYRKLLMYKALANITDSSLASLNKMLPLLFDDASFIVKNVIVEGTSGTQKYNQQPMRVRYTIDGDLSETDAALFAVGGALSLSAGVGWSLVAAVGKVFGFDGSGLQPFDRGTFMNENNIITS